MFIWTWWSSKVTTCPSELQLAVFLTVGPSGPGPGRLSVLAATCHFTHNERSDSSVHRKKGACNQCVFQPFLLVQVWPRWNTRQFFHPDVAAWLLTIYPWISFWSGIHQLFVVLSTTSFWWTLFCDFVWSSTTACAQWPQRQNFHGPCKSRTVFV